MSLHSKELSGDLHCKQYNHLRIKGLGCKRHCQCKWCIENRTHKVKRSFPVDEFGKLYNKVYY